MKERKERAGQKREEMWVKLSGWEWWVVGLGGGTCGPQSDDLHFFFFFLKLTVCYKSSFSQPFLIMALSFSTLNNQYCFIISLKSTLLWFSRNPPHSIIVVLRSKQILFLHLTTTFVHKVTHNKACIVLPCFRGFGWPGNPINCLSSNTYNDLQGTSSSEFNLWYQ